MAIQMRSIFYFFLIAFSFAGFGQNNKPLNVVFIAVDDLKPSIRSFGDAYAVTPNMDMLARKSSLFLNTHTQQAICSPSRISLLTGLRPDKTQVYDLKTRMRDKLPNVVTLPQYFKQMGYTTAGVGKIFDPRGVDKQSDGISWSVPFKRAYQLKYPKDWGQPMLGYYQNQQIKEKIKAIVKKENIPSAKVGDYLKTVFRPPFSSSPAPDEAYADGAIAAEALRMIDDLSQNNKPFFLAVGFKRPHLPFSAPQKYWNFYNSARMPLALFQERGSNIGRLAFKGPGEISKYPMDDRFYTTDNNGQLNLDEAFQRELVHGYYACVSFIDFQIGKVVNKLKKKGLMDNTIIVIWGDHGFHLGDHRMWTKHSNFEQATRSPLIIYNPRTRVAQKIMSPTEFVDVFPTLTDMAQIAPPANVDGTSLLPMMMGQQQSVKEFAVSQYPRNNKMGYSFRTAAYRYTLWVNKSKIGQKITDKDIVQEELVDLNLNIYTNRFKGYKESLKYNGIDFRKELVFQANSDIASGRKVARQILSSDANIDAIFCSSDYIALGVMQELKEQNVSIPDDVAVVGFSNEPFTELLDLTLTSIEQSPYEMGKSAARVFLDQMNSKNANIEHAIKLKPKLCIRDSSLKNNRTMHK